MIRVSRLDGTMFVVNAEHVQQVERTPDTVITLVNGAKFIVREPVEEIVNRVISYRRRIANLDWSEPEQPMGDPRG